MVEPTAQGSEEDKAKEERESTGARCRFCGPVAAGPSYGLHVGPAVLLAYLRFRLWRTCTFVPSCAAALAPPVLPRSTCRVRSRSRMYMACKTFFKDTYIV